jgi:polyhydroxyalkanoate synthase
MIKVPSFFLSTHEDHITPWKSSYAGGQMLKGPLTFTLASSGHIAGIINPPAANKYWYWTSDKEVKEPDVWLNSASRVAGSWWPSWGQWYSQLNADKVPFRDPTKGSLKPIEEAPGAYVKMRI